MPFGLTVAFLGACLRQVLRGLSLRGFFHVLLFEGQGLGTGTISQETGGLCVVGLSAEHDSPVNCAHVGKCPPHIAQVKRASQGNISALPYVEL